LDVDMAEAKKKRSDSPTREKSMQERVLERVRKMSSDERFDLMVSAGIYTRDGKLTPQYQS
jgi:hypothetical protein